MEAEIQALRGELGRTRVETKSAVSAVAQKADAQDAAVEARLVEQEKHEKSHHDLLFFRGGYASMTHPRNDELLTGGTPSPYGPVATSHNQGNGWYIGAGFDHRLTDDLWGLTDMAALDGEVMFQYMNFGTSTNGLVNFVASNLIVPGKVTNQVTQLTLTASPKIKFNLLDGNFRPWVIPFGLSINVISPPSSGVTVLNPGLQLGLGGEYRLWESLWAGVDFRYNFTGNDLNYSYNTLGGKTVLKGMSTDGLTAGGYLGFGF
jgi:hypothetical protein